MRFSLLATLASLAFTYAKSSEENINDPWSFNVGSGQYADWMQRIKDNTPLSSLSIPGTHNSMTDKLDNGLLRGQDTPLAQQLTGGIRYIDITLQNTDNNLLVYHGTSKTGYNFEEVLTTIYNFLDDHCREAVIIRIQKSTLLNGSQAFTDLLRGYLNPGTPIGNRAAQYVYNRGTPASTTLPTLGDLRGKLFILQDFDTKPSGVFGFPWSSPLISNHHFKFGVGKLLVGAKWHTVRKHIEGLSRKSAETLYITDMTVSVGSKPISIATGDEKNPGMNGRLGIFLKDTKGGDSNEFLFGFRRARLGVISMDFPGKNLVEQILKFNKFYEEISTAEGYSQQPPPSPGYSDSNASPNTNSYPNPTTAPAPTQY
ncbi:1-phosphatidylinositol phosphodiesterase [Ceratocystis lukuohia]|uniref:1-phosphatidylinositol phosphodiesterase n=2 Tax=Ceratocystis TaxID=5157 RepID=A0A0F8D8J1_CERFI|nr:1-phosphatidylinositol phosphodiesterase [Ceratocystis platani]